MSGPTPLPCLTCRECGRNLWVYVAPVVVEAAGTCICMHCAEACGWLDPSGNLKPGVTV